MNRRDFLIKSAFAASLPVALSACQQAPLAYAGPQTAAQERKPGRLSWLDGNEPTSKEGTTWGHPWAQGELSTDQALHLISQRGEKVPLQSWPTAYWPDGSVKWTAHAVPANSELGEQFTLAKGQGPDPTFRVEVHESATEVRIENGIFTCVVPKDGPHIVQRLERDGKIIGQQAKLVGLVQDQPYSEPGVTTNVEQFESNIEKVALEQQGPVRAVVKLMGKHRTTSGREWLPFTLRLYIYSGGESLQISHSFVYDGDDQQDFIKGLGLQFDVPQRDEFYNRHVRFVGEDGGLWAESPQGITGLRRDPGKAVRDAQIAGVKTPPLSEWEERVRTRMHWIPVWNDFTLSQLNANSFAIKKRTKAGHTWIDADQGKRAQGAAYIGGVSGGILFGMRDFWQLHPVQLDIRNAGGDSAQATLWFWSPEAPAMDVRFYHDGLGQDTHQKQLDAMNITYEDYEPGFGTAYGVARTTDMRLFVLNATPTRDHTIAMADIIAQPPLVVASPHDYLQAGVFGSLWTLPDRSNKYKVAIENRLEWQIDYYQQQVDQRHWYGFWNYGDVMHAYDTDRHVWRYDVGGYAWDNSELSPDLWLWYSFLRSGDPKAFRLAENMTRHTRDVDIYHAGPFRGLGTRHNVQHWGCSAKQLRISTAAYRRFHYYLTADDRTGDVLWEVADADQMLGELNPTRKVDRQPLPPGQAQIGVGTDWGSAAANWLTAWERTGDPRYKDYLERSMRVIGEHPHGFFAGSFLYDVSTRTLVPHADRPPSLSHLSAVFGLIEICTELNQLFDIPAFKAAWLQYGRLYNASAEEQRAALGVAFGNNSLTNAHSRLTAYVAHREQDRELAERAWAEFAREWNRSRNLEVKQLTGPVVLNPTEEAAWMSTNEAAQWGLAAIQNLALIGSEVRYP
ncbi:exo-rhamnogalacturonan lyase family protein [Marinimicrobium alkaliphilum]|uniref:exo-rhamnogalacturonan lyase family protein n=1 Tax=Marinimicrobium alkaliphilum TaxID=2202654 RepID=UPI000DBA73EE|nr:Tat pathway signal sequence domain protein [Marinimicrobium alkaliphilum]